MCQYGRDVTLSTETPCPETCDGWVTETSRSCSLIGSKIGTTGMGSRYYSDRPRSSTFYSDGFGTGECLVGESVPLLSSLFGYRPFSSFGIFGIPWTPPGPFSCVFGNSDDRVLPRHVPGPSGSSLDKFPGRLGPRPHHPRYCHRPFSSLYPGLQFFVIVGISLSPVRSGNLPRSERRDTGRGRRKVESSVRRPQVLRG